MIRLFFSFVNPGWNLFDVNREKQLDKRRIQWYTENNPIMRGDDFDAVYGFIRSSETGHPYMRQAYEACVACLK